MKNVWIVLSIVCIAFLSGCAQEPPDVLHAYGLYDNEQVRIEASAIWDSDQKVYLVEARVYNQSDEDLQLVYDCNDFIHYQGKLHDQQGCDAAYSMELRSGASYYQTIEVPLEKVDFIDGSFTIDLTYELGNNPGDSTMAHIALQPGK
jgi:hypothetical protein